MAWGAPKRNGRCPLCKQKGRCSCQRRINAELARNPSAKGTCSAMCGWNGKGKSCGRTTRSGVCPCPNC
jgi:hypothetical protein